MHGKAKNAYKIMDFGDLGINGITELQWILYD
jgi:hypothetical protein